MEKKEKEKEIVTSVTYIAGLGPAKNRKKPNFWRDPKEFILGKILLHGGKYVYI